MIYNEDLTEIYNEELDYNNPDFYWNIDYDFTLLDQIANPTNEERVSYEQKLDFDFYTSRILTGYGDHYKKMVFDQSLRMYKKLLKSNFKSRDKEGLIINIIEDVLLDCGIDPDKTDIGIFK